MGMLIHHHFVEADKAIAKPAPEVEEDKAEEETIAPKKKGGRKKATAE